MKSLNSHPRMRLMSSNYPPGVTGNEPEITGEFEWDRHTPFWVSEGEHAGRFAVYFGDGEGMFFTANNGGWTNEKHAQDFADKLNERYGLRHEDAADDGHCRVCGDYHGEPPGSEEPEYNPGVEPVSKKRLDEMIDEAARQED